MITWFSIVTLVFFIISIILVIQPVSFPIRLPYVGRKRISLDLLTAPILTIALLWAAQCLGPTQIRDGIVGTDGVKPYNILILFFSLAYMAITLDITGTLQAAAFWVSNKGGSNGWKLFFYFYLMLAMLGIILGNDPVVLSGTPFLVYYTSATGLEPVPWLMAEFAATNTASMVLFLGNLTNVVICEGFAFQFFNTRYIPKKLRHTGYLNPKDVLCDPVGAWVGSVLLGSCLVAVIVVSFFNVDVWKVTLPFAVAKCIWDLCWDHFQYLTGRIPCACRLDGKEGESDNPVKTADEKRKDTFASTSPTLGNTFTSTPTPLSPTPITPITGVPESVEKTPADSNASKHHAIIPGPFPALRLRLQTTYSSLCDHFPTFFLAIPRLPFALAPFSFSQFILIEALAHQGWIDVVARWLVIVSKGQIHPCIWLVGVLGVILCGTNIGATILLTKVVRPAEFSSESTRASGIALAVASNIGAVSFTFSASLAGLLWKMIIQQKGIKIKQKTFAFWNLLPIFMMTGVGLGVVSAPLVVESLCMELQRPGLEDGYRKRCMKYLKAMGKKFHALPPSLFMNNITRSGDHALTGGGFADIFKGKAGNMDVCLKVLRVHTAGSAEDRIRIIADFCQEALIWTQLRHSNILPLLGVNTELFPSCFCLVSPWMVNGDIISFLKKHPNHDKLQSVCEIVAGLEYLHSLSPPIAHGDIKGANILVDEDHHCRLADFGLAVISAETISMASGTSGVFKGSIRWMAPEMYAFTIGTYVETNVKEDKAPRDIYAFGCTVLEILTGKPPFFNLIEAAVIYQVSVCRIRPERPSQSWCPDHIWNLIELCWDEDSVKRPTANAIHTYLQRLMLSDTATSGDSAYIGNFHPAQSSTL